MSPMSFLFASVALIALCSATCNLLDTGNTAYIDTESENAILTMCAGDTSSLSLWEQYQCDYILHRDGWMKCWPQRRMSECAPGQLKGAIFLYHGYSACPDQYNDLAPKLTADCWHVYGITTLGHGYDLCDNNATDAECVAAMFNVSGMPTSRAPYIDYITMMIEVIEDEVSIIKECETAANSAFSTDDLEVVTGGLSFGAPLAAASVVFSGSDSVFTKHMLMSPFFGVSTAGADNLIYKCLLNTATFRECLPTYFEMIGFNITSDQAEGLTSLVMDALSFFVDVDLLDTTYETLNLLVRYVLTWVVENPDAITDTSIRANIDTVLTTVVSWGDQCVLDVEQRNRGGFCSFFAANLLAAHSFANYVVEALEDTAHDTSVETLLILVERDGATRNSLVAEYVNRFYAYSDELIYSKVNDCMWLISGECQEDEYDGPINNECGVPHSSMSPADNLGIPPYSLYWNETYHDGIIAWINNADSLGDKFAVKTAWNSYRDECVYFDVVNPPPILIADVPRIMTIGLNIVRGQVTEAIQNAILDAISGLTGVPRGVLQLSYALTTSANGEDSDSDYYEFQVALDSDGGQLMTTLLENDAVNEIANYTVTHVSVDGNDYAPTPAPTTGDTDGSGRFINLQWLIAAAVCMLYI